MLTPKNHARLLNLSTAQIADARVSLQLAESHLDPGIRPVVLFSRMVGCAVTVRLEAAADETSGDLSLLIETYEAQSPEMSSIIVIQVPEAFHRYGIVGEGAATVSRAHGFTGALVEGASRDSHELRAMEFPVFSRTIAPGDIVGKVTAVAAREPVVIGGRTIHSGDVVVGDHDGVVTIRPNEIADVTDKAEAINEWEDRLHAALAERKSRKEALATAGPKP